jgi:hypothetical protein
MQEEAYILMGERERSGLPVLLSVIYWTFLCCVSKRDINRSPHNTKQPLINSIMEILSNFSKDTVKRACSQYQWRLKEDVTAEYDFIR